MIYKKFQNFNIFNKYMLRLRISKLIQLLFYLVLIFAISAIILSHQDKQGTLKSFLERPKTNAHLLPPQKLPPCIEATKNDVVNSSDTTLFYEIDESNALNNNKTITLFCIILTTPNRLKKSVNMFK